MEKTPGLSPYYALDAATQEHLERASQEAQAQGVVPQCPGGHGALELMLSRARKLYWKCPCHGCEEWAWYKSFSAQKCPQCGEAMEKVPSAKVKGGNFLKCGKVSGHAQTKEVVMFRNAKSGKWELPRA